MRPLQLWLPAWEVSPVGSAFAYDLQRAFAVWDGDCTVWFMPGLTRVERWENPSLMRQEVAIPAHYFNRVAIYHVGRKGHIWGLGARTYFPSGRIDDDLLDTLLSVGVRGAWDAGEPREVINVTEWPLIRCPGCSRPWPTRSGATWWRGWQWATPPSTSWPRPTT